MKIAAVITIDTEGDHRGGGWIKSEPLTLRSVLEGVPGILTPLFARYAARPTYLLTTEVMGDDRSVEVLRGLTDAELGTHLHGDHVAPEPRRPVIDGARTSDFNCFYPAELERAKLQTLTRQFQDRFGRAPRSYRAGRYAASGRSLATLAELGYRVDTSVAPQMRWVHEDHPEQVLDFHGAPSQPYRPSLENAAQPGALEIWEVPITILERPRWWNSGVRAVQRALGRAQTSYPAWLRPSTTPSPWLRWIVRRVMQEERQLTVFNVMLHSMEVIAGASPYSATPADARRIIRRLDWLCGHLSSAGAQFLTLSQLADALDSAQR